VPDTFSVSDSFSVSIGFEPVDWGFALAEIGNGNYAAAVGLLPGVPAGSAAILRKTKAGEWVIDFVKKSDLLTGAVMHHFEKHHAWFRILGGSDEMHNLVKIHAHMHRGAKIGVHQHILNTLKLDTFEQLHGLWMLALSAAEKGNDTAMRKLAQSILESYRSYFKLSPDYDRIILIFKNALELETGIKLK
jgi:hypothetical protein